MAKPFLDVCRLILPVIDKLGASFMLVKSDVQGNIDRLDQRMNTDPKTYENLFAIVLSEVAAGDYNDSSSCTKGLLWLKRAMEFVLGILASLDADPHQPLPDIVKDTYTSTLYQFHGFLVSSAFTVAFQFLPAREAFYHNVGVNDSNAKDLAEFIGAFSPVVKQVHEFLASKGLDDPAKV